MERSPVASCSEVGIRPRRVRQRALAQHPIEAAIVTVPGLDAGQRRFDEANRGQPPVAQARPLVEDREVEHALAGFRPHTGVLREPVMQPGRELFEPRRLVGGERQAGALQRPREGRGEVAPLPAVRLCGHQIVLSIRAPVE